MNFVSFLAWFMIKIIKQRKQINFQAELSIWIDKKIYKLAPIRILRKLQKILNNECIDTRDIMTLYILIIYSQNKVLFYPSYSKTRTINQEKLDDFK